MRPLTIILILFISVTVKAQSKYNYGIELGLNRNTLSQTKKSYGAQRGGIVEDFTQGSFGLNFKKNIKKHFSLNLNLYYKRMHQYLHYQWITDNNYGYGETNLYADMKFSKLTLLLSAEYGFGKKKCPGLLIGIEPNYFLNGYGNIYINQLYQSQSPSSISLFSQAEYFGFVNNKVNTDLSHYYTIKRLKLQIATGITFPMFKHFQLNATAHIGFPFERYFIQDEMYILLRNNDFNISISYFLNRLYNEKPKEDILITE